jgi:hypothetical protein
MMRTLLLTVAILSACNPAPAWVAGGQQKAKVAPQPTPVETMIRSVFGSSDRNKNGVLSQVEFHRAQANLHLAIEELAQSRQLGVGKKNSRPASNGAAAFGLPLVDVNKSNQISLSDFTAYAQAEVQRAIATKQAQADASKRSQPGGRGRSNARRPPQRRPTAVATAPRGNSPAKQGKPAAAGKQAQPTKAEIKKK